MLETKEMSTKVNIEVDHAVRLAAHLLIQRTHGKYCDVCICVEEKRFLAHKCVISSNTPKLDSLIMDAVGQSGGNQDIEIEIQGVSPVGFETLLEYFYTGNLNLTSNTVMPVWMTAAYLELPNVVKLCDDFCQKNITCVSSQNTEDSEGSPQKTDMLKKSKSNSPPPEASSVVEVIDDDPEKMPSDEVKTSNDDVDKSRNFEGSSLTPLQTATGGDYTPSNPIPKTQAAKSRRPKKWIIPLTDVGATNPTGTDVSGGVTSTCGIIELEPSVVEVQCDLREPSVVEVQCDLPLGDEKPPPGCEDMMMEVERLRLQHERLKRLHQQKKVLNRSNSTQLSEIEDPPNKKTKITPEVNTVPILDEKCTVPPSTPEFLGGSPPSSPMFSRLFRGGQSPSAGFKFITPQDLKDLYQKYSIAVEPPIPATSTAIELLQKGKSRVRKSTEQNALNTAIRQILDLIDITDSTHPAVEDALIIIMDRFDSLRLCINNPLIRRNLLVKVRHSIHCKKWRIKKQMSKGAGNSGDGNSKKLVVKVETDEDSLHG